MASQNQPQYAPQVYFPLQPVPQPVAQPVQYPPPPLQYLPQPVHYPPQPAHYPPQPAFNLPQPLPFLDHLNKPTQVLITFANALFDYLDRSYEPKGTQVLEETKMTALVFLSTADAERPMLDQHKTYVSWTLNLGYFAFSVETVFTNNGPSVTRQGFLTYLRSEISGDPDEAFKDYTRVNQALRLAPPIVRSQLPQLPDRQMKDTMEQFKRYTAKKWQELSISGARQGNFDEEMERQKVQEQKNVLSNMRVQMARNQLARMEKNVEIIGRLGSNVCFRCGRYDCFC